MKLINLNQKDHSFSAILLAGGSSSRMNGIISDKTLEKIQDKPVFAYSLESFIASRIFKNFLIVYRDEPQKKWIQACIEEHYLEDFKSVMYIQGGSTRQESVFNGLTALKGKTDFVFIHDFARPLVKVEQLKQIAQSLPKFGAVALAAKPRDTIHQIDSIDPDFLTPLNRDKLWAMQTPQAFDYHLISDAYEKLKTMPLTDCCSAVAILGHAVKIIENLYPNPKLTKPEDFLYIKTLIEQKQSYDRI